MILTNIILAVLVLVQIYALIKRAQFERKNYQDLFKDKFIEENEKVEEMSKKIEKLWKYHETDLEDFKDYTTKSLSKLRNDHEEKIKEISDIQAKMKLNAKNHLKTYH